MEGEFEHEIALLEFLFSSSQLYQSSCCDYALTLCVGVPQGDNLVGIVLQQCWWLCTETTGIQVNLSFIATYTIPSIYIYICVSEDCSSKKL